MEEERRAWDMYAARVPGTGSSNGLPPAAIDAAEYAEDAAERWLDPEIHAMCVEAIDYDRMRQRADAAEARLAQVEAALERLFTFDIYSTFDAKGSYTARKAVEWSLLCEQARALLTPPTKEMP
jgi:hypothetical protein